MNNSDEAVPVADVVDSNAQLPQGAPQHQSAMGPQRERRSSWPEAIANTFHVNAQGIVHLPFVPLPLANIAERPLATSKVIQRRSKS